jgi:hypothetical protein
MLAQPKSQRKPQGAGHRDKTARAVIHNSDYASVD